MKTYRRLLLSLLILGAVSDMPVPEGLKPVVGVPQHTAPVTATTD
jgi:hypothetical protein